MYIITAPNREYDGDIAGVTFHAGVSVPVAQVPEYFRRHTAYKVEQVHAETTAAEESADAETPKRTRRRKTA